MRPVTAAFDNARHPRDRNGKFIDLGAILNIKGDSGEERRAKVIKMTSMGPQVQYDDGSVEILQDPKQITVAPPARARLAPDVFHLPKPDASVEEKQAALAAMEAALKEPPDKVSAESKTGIRRNIKALQADLDKTAANVPAGTGPENAAKIAQVAKLHGIDSPEYKQAIVEFGGKGGVSTNEKGKVVPGGVPLNAPAPAARGRATVPAAPAGKPRPLRMDIKEVDERASLKFGFQSKAYTEFMDKLSKAQNKYGYNSPQYQKLLQQINFNMGDARATAAEQARRR